ncbi:MAG: RNA-binding S4 domain-containing protein [Pseudomonadota bacterium]|nr:RNA-binding S4 domain-containing protein [Pseudomonadota bacterium]MEC8462210.1 RNA-binding S4 domain-containing protein [Pseudomonadota bacterium]MEC9208065.1 RNA-binding S4 domain-containing protein [Pseudomonadota bacterium]
MNQDSIRLDIWLWRARFFKSRTLAGKICTEGKVRVNGKLVCKAHYRVRVGQVLTFPGARAVYVVRIRGLGLRRGPAQEAQKLYTKVLPPQSSVRIAGKSPTGC